MSSFDAYWPAPFGEPLPVAARSHYPGDATPAFVAGLAVGSVLWAGAILTVVYWLRRALS